MAGDIKKREEKFRIDFQAATDAKLRFFWVCWTLLAVVCFATLTISIIALKQVRDLKKASVHLSNTALNSEFQLSAEVPTEIQQRSETLEGRYEVLTHNLTVLSKKYMKMFRSMKEMLEEHEKSPTGHASGSIQVEVDKLRADFNEVLKKYVKRKGNKFLKISNYEKTSKEIRSMLDRLDLVVSDLLEQVQLKLGIAHLEKEAIRLGFVKSDLNGIRKTGSPNNCVRASELALFVKTELSPYVRLSQMDSIFKQSNFTLYFTQQLNELKRTYMTKRSAKTYVDMQAHESREELVVRLNENTRTRLQSLQDNINSRINLMHKDLQLLTSTLPPKNERDVCTGGGGACNAEARQVLTTLSGHFEPGAWDLGNADKRVDMVKKFRQLQEDFFQNQTEQMSIVHEQRQKLEAGLQKVTKLYAEMNSSMKSGMNTIRQQIQQNAQELERISEAAEDLSRRQKQTQSALNTFKTASYRMMATKADLEALTQQTQQTKVGLRELRDIQIRSLSKDVNELKENEMKYLKFQVVQLSNRIQDIVQSNHVQAGQHTLTEMEGFKSKLTNLEQVLTSLFKEVQGSGAKEAIGT